jgi:hypothetical protein
MSTNELDDFPEASDVMEGPTNEDTNEGILSEKELADLYDVEPPPDDDETPEDDTKKEATEDDDDTDDDDAGEAEATEDAPPRSARIDPELAEMAKQVGLDPDDFTSNAALTKHLLAAQQKQPEREQDEQVVEEEEFKIDLDLDDDLFDPELKTKLNSQLNKLNEHYGQKTKKLSETVDQLRSELRERDLFQAEQQFEQYINGLGDEWEDVFGKGNGRSMDRSSTAFKNRGKFWDKLSAVVATHQRDGTMPEESDALFKEALHSAFGDQVEKVATKKVSKKLRDRQGRFTNRPTQRKSKSHSDEAAAEEFVRGWIAENPIGAEDFSDDDF